MNGYRTAISPRSVGLDGLQGSQGRDYNEDQSGPGERRISSYNQGATVRRVPQPSFAMKPHDGLVNASFGKMQRHRRVALCATALNGIEGVRPLKPISRSGDGDD